MKIEISNQDREFETIKWVIAAKHKDQHRNISKVMFDSDTGQVCATDGHRLHVATIPDSRVWNEIESGTFEIIKNTKSKIEMIPSGDIEDFPNIDKVISCYSDKPEKQELFVSKKEELLLKVCLGSKRMFELDYLVDATSFCEVWTMVYEKDSEKAIHFVNGNRYSIVMPVDYRMLSHDTDVYDLIGHFEVA